MINKRNVIWTMAILIAAGSLTGFFIYKKASSKLTSPSPTELHYSYFSQKQFFDDAYAAAKPGNYPRDEKAILVNHHLLAANLIAEAFNTVATKAPITVLLISPNHFDVGKADIITSVESWQTPYGVLEPDKLLIDKLIDKQIAKIEEQPFEQEHGVSGIVAFIKKSLPNAKVVPIIFRNRMTLKQSLSLADEYYKLAGGRTLIVGSFDFSHYLPNRVADFHDLDNLAAITNFDFSKIYKLDLDSRPGLAFFLKLIQDSGDQQFQLLENTNSAKLIGKDILETTSYITGYFIQGKAATSLVQTLLSLPSFEPPGGLMQVMDKKSKDYALTYLERFFFGQDTTVTFLEKSNTAVKSRLTKFGVQPIFGIKFEKNLGPLKIIILDCATKANSAHINIDQGADVVICQGASKNYLEIYKNKAIVYAAGNLFGLNSMAAGLGYVENQLKIYLFPMGLDGKQVKLLIGEENGKVLTEMAKNSNVSVLIQNQIIKGLITIDNFK